MKLVIDTNVVESGLFFGGKPLNLLKMLLQGELESFVSEEIVSEYQRIFDGMIEKYHLTQSEVTLSRIISRCTLVQPTRKISVCRDPDDNKFTDCAIVAQADMLVTDDAHFREAAECPFPSVRVVSLDDFSARMQAE